MELSSLLLNPLTNSFSRLPLPLRVNIIGSININSFQILKRLHYKLFTLLLCHNQPKCLFSAQSGLLSRGAAEVAPLCAESASPSDGEPKSQEIESWDSERCPLLGVTKEQTCPPRSHTPTMCPFRTRMGLLLIASSLWKPYTTLHAPPNPAALQTTFTTKPVRRGESRVGMCVATRWCAGAMVRVHVCVYTDLPKAHGWLLLGLECGRHLLGPV